MGLGVMNRIETAHDRDSLAGACDSGNKLPDSIYCGEFLDNRKHVSISKRTLLNGVNYRVDYIRHMTD